MKNRIPDFQALFESAPGLYLVLTPALTIAAVSDAYLRATMTTRAQILGRDLFEVFPDNPDDLTATGASNLRASLDRVLKQRVPDTMAVQKYDIRRSESEGGGFEERYWSPVNSPVLGINGEVAYIIHRVEDVTEFVRLKQAVNDPAGLTEKLLTHTATMEADILRGAQQIQEVNNQLRTELQARRQAEEERDRFFTMSLDLLCIAGFDGYFKRLNPAWERTLGFTVEELCTTPYVDFIHPEDRERTFAAGRQLLEGHDIISFENRYRCKDGSYKWLLWNSTPAHDSKLIYAAARDITERKQAEEDHLRLAAIIESSGDAIISKTLNSIVTSWNRGAEELFGYTAEEIIGRSICVLFPDDRLHEEIDIMARVKAGEIVDHFETVRRRKDGRLIPVSVTISPIIDSKGRIIGVSKVARNITKQQEYEQALQSAKAEADRANQAKSEFLSRMSHELRTPLNAILGFAQLLELEALPLNQRESVAYILKGGRHLLTLINEVLDIARIETGGLSLSLEPVAVRHVVAEAFDLLKPLAAQRNVQLHCDLAAMDHIFVVADQQRLKQVLLNLLSNGVKYNREGGALILSCEQPSESRLKMVVADTGPGMTHDQLTRLFTPFDRLGAEHTGIEGSGLGLALSQNLVKAMGGSIHVTSKVGEGSIFSVELARANNPEEQIKPLQTEAPALSVCNNFSSPIVSTVLYIEDNLSNLHLIERIVAMRPGIRLLSAMQGRLGLDLARQQRPDLILLDLHLPDLQGDEVLAHLRAHPQTREIPVVMVSADATPRQVQRLLEAGAAAYLTKPIEVAKLMAQLDQMLKPGVR